MPNLDRIDEQLTEQVGEEAPLDVRGEALANVQHRQDILPPAARDRATYVQAGAPNPTNPYPPPPIGDSYGGGQFAPDQPATPSYGADQSNVPVAQRRYKTLEEANRYAARDMREGGYGGGPLSFEAQQESGLMGGASSYREFRPDLRRPWDAPSNKPTWDPASGEPPPAPDPSVQALVQQEEQAIDKVKQDQMQNHSLGPSQLQYALGKRQRNIDGLDPNGWYRRGGMYSQMTAAQKAFNQSTIFDPKTGGLYSMDGHGGFRTLVKPEDQAKHKEMALKLEQQAAQFKQTFDLNHQRYLHAEAEAQRKRDEHQHTLEERQFQRQVRENEFHADEHGKVYKMLRQKDPNTGQYKEPSEDQVQAVMRQRREHTQEQRREALGEEARQTESQFLDVIDPEQKVNREAYREAYSDAHAHLAPARTATERRQRAEAAVQHLMKKYEARLREPARTKAAKAEISNLTGIADPAKAAAAGLGVPSPKPRERGIYSTIGEWGMP